MWAGDEDQCDAREARHERLRLGAHQDEGAGSPARPWPAYAHSQAEQPPFRSALAAAKWAEDHGEDLNAYDDWSGDDCD